MVAGILGGCSSGSTTVAMTDGAAPATDGGAEATSVDSGAGDGSGTRDAARGDGSKEAGPPPSTANPIGINMLADGQYSPNFDGFPMWKNLVRQSGFEAPSHGAPIALTAAGWPATDFSCHLYQVVGGAATQSWTTGTYSCGFNGTGSETITGIGGTINKTSSSSPTVRFTLTAASSANIIGFTATGTTGGATDVFCYMPKYNTLTSIDDWADPSGSAFTDEAVAFYKQFHHMRTMWPSNSLYDTSVMTSANRNSPTNCQSNPVYNHVSQGTPEGAGMLYTLTATPGAGATSATLSTPWPNPTGNYNIVLQGGGGLSGDDTYQTARLTTITNGSAALSWTNPLQAAATAAQVYVGFDGVPAEVWVGLANATGTMGLWVNTPVSEDGTYASAGSYTTAIMQYLAANYTSSGPVYFETGNENWWNGGYLATPVLINNYGLANDDGADFASSQDYYGYLMHATATLGRKYLPSGWWGTKAFVINGQQAAPGNGPYYTSELLEAMTSRFGAGTPTSDAVIVAIAPYITPTIGATDSVDAVIADVQRSASAGDQWEAEQDAVLCLSYGAVGFVSYESGVQWNAAQQGDPNVTPAQMSAAVTAPLETLFQTYFDCGFDLLGHFGAGVWANGGNVIDDELSNDYATLITTGSPTLAALQKFESGITYTRNVVTPGAGSSVPGNNFLSNWSSTLGSLATAEEQDNIYQAPWISQGGVSTYLVKSTAAGTVTNLEAVFQNVSGSPTTNLYVNSMTALRTGISVANGTVSLGSIKLHEGKNWIALGIPGHAQGTATTNQIAQLKNF
jgi:hypothetical protein